MHYAGLIKTKTENSLLEVRSTTLIPYTFCQIQRIAPHGPLAVH